MRDPYLYPDSEVLKNLSDIHNMDLLKNMEADYTAFRLTEIVAEDAERKYDFMTLCNMHYQIFQDIYEWAGKPRVINIEKAEIVLGEISIEYSDCFGIVKDAEYVLDEMNRYDWQNASFENVVRRFSDYMAKLWRVHPYREGNTRTIVTFCCMFIESQGIYIESNLFKDNASYMRSALVAANAVFHDLGDLRKPEYLYRIVQDALERGNEMSNRVEDYIRKAELPVTGENIRKVVFWNRKEQKEHSVEEIRNYLRKQNKIVGSSYDKFKIWGMRLFFYGT